MRLNGLHIYTDKSTYSDKPFFRLIKLRLPVYRLGAQIWMNIQKQSLIQVHT